MAEVKRYYWLKLKDDFFSSKRIKKLRRIAGGDTYTIIYLKMQLLSLSKGGILEYTGLEESFAEELALDLDEDIENVKVTIQFLLNCGLLETSDNVQYLLPFVADGIGSETASAQRSREYRNKHKVEKVLQCNNNAISLQQKPNVDIDIDTDIDIEYAIPEFDLEGSFKKMFDEYPKKKNYQSCRCAYLDLFKGLPQSTYEDVANSLSKAMFAFAKDYKEHNPNDTTYKFVPALDSWLKEDAVYWVSKVDNE